MKRIFYSIALLIVACSICSLVAYRAGLAQAKERQKGTFLMTFFGLQQIRGGMAPEGIIDVEKVCFANANRIYGDPSDYGHDAIIAMSTPELIKYIATYCTNRSEWTPEEQQLEKRLASLNLGNDVKRH